MQLNQSPAQLSLPFYSHLSSLDASLNLDTPTLLIGATGCGKSTQLPQHLLRKSPDSSILVAQPRRLAATSIAQRVSTELSSNLGETVGYAIRGDQKTSSSTRCTFVTYGVLTRMLASSSKLSCTHLVLDEVHERSADLDLILLFLKQLKNPPKLILMSATVDATLFTSYFPALTTVTVPGRTFPVTRYYLEHAIAHANYITSPASPAARSPALPDVPAEDPLLAEIKFTQASLTVATSQTVIENLTTRLASLTAASQSLTPSDPMTALLAPLSLVLTQSTFDLPSLALARSLRTLSPHVIPNELVAALVRKHTQTEGDVLVFLPGLKEISVLSLSLSSNPNLLVLPLHSSLSTAEQHAVFATPPASKTKVILATSIAEASITVPSITLVIDTCLSRTQTLDPATNLSHLSTHLSSKSSIDQRAGRAGRVQAGTCYHLILSPTLTALDPSPSPEILTTPLDSFSLRSRLLLQQTGSTKDILADLLTPPLPSVAAAADATLTACGALSSVPLSLTPHGTVLANLPLSLPHALALVAAHRLGCLDDMSCLLAALTSPAASFSGEDKRRADRTSDHVALLRLARNNGQIKKESARLANTARDLLGCTDRKLTSTLPSFFAALLMSSPQTAPFTNAIYYATASRTHSLKPHNSSVLHGARGGGHVFFGDVLKLPAGAMVMDASVVPPEAVATFTELEDVEGVEGEERELLRSFKQRLDRVVLGEEDGGGAVALLSLVLKSVVRDWSGLPEGWEFEEEGGGRWRTKDGAISQATRPTEPASVALAKKQAASGSLARAERELGGGKGGERGAPPPMITAAAAGGKKKAASEEEAKQAVKIRLKEEEESTRRKAAGSKKLGAVAKMLKELGLEDKYAAKFAEVDVSDEDVRDIMAMAKEEGEKEEAEKGVQSVLEKVGLVGGSMSKVRRYLMDGGKVAPGGGGGKAKAKAQAAPPAVVVKKKKEKKKDDLSLLDAPVGKKKGGKR